MMYNIIVLTYPIFLKGDDTVFRFHAMGMDTHHTADFRIDRPHGSGDCLLIIFKTDALLTLNGREQKVPPDSAILFKEDEPQHYRAVCGSYVNHYLHFGREGDSHTGIRFGELLLPYSVRDAELLMRMLSREVLSASAGQEREEYISLLMTLLLMKLSEPSGERRAAAAPYLEQLDELRAALYSEPARFRSVADMAKALNLSPSYFQKLYKKRFGVSGYEDLLTAKIRTAQYFLSSAAMSIREIAAVCGYDNEVCFMHRFKQRTGMTPSGYRAMVTDDPYAVPSVLPNGSKAKDPYTAGN